MGSKGTSTTTQNTTQNTRPPEFVYSALQDLIARGQQTANTPFSTYGGPRLAGFTGDQTSAFDAIRANMGAYQPYLGEAADYARQGAAPLTTSYQQYLNPYQKQVTDATMAQIAEADAQQRKALNGNMIARGAFGNDRGGVQHAELARQQAMARNSTLAGLNSNNYTAALSAAQQDALRAGQASYTMGNLGQLSQSLGLQGAGALLNSGGMQQQQNQAGLNIPYQDWQQQRSYPFQTTQWLASILGVGAPLAGGTTQGSGTSTTTPAQPSIFSQIGGLGLAGLGLFGGKAAGGRVGYYDGGAIEGGDSIAPDAQLTPSQGLNVPAFHMTAPEQKAAGGGQGDALKAAAKVAMMFLRDGGRVGYAGGGGLGGGIFDGIDGGIVPASNLTPSRGLNVPAFQMSAPSGAAKPAWDPMAMGKAAAPVLGKAKNKFNDWMNEPQSITPERFSFSPGAIGSVGGIGEMNPSAGIAEPGMGSLYADGGFVGHPRLGYAGGGELDDGIDIPARVAAGHTVNSDYWVPADANAERIVRSSRGFDPMGDPSPTDVWPAKPKGGWSEGLGVAPAKPRLLPSEMNGPVAAAPTGGLGVSPALSYLQSGVAGDDGDDGEDHAVGSLPLPDEMSSQARRSAAEDYLKGVEDPSKEKGGLFGLSPEGRMGLIAAGLGIAGGTSPFAGVNIGQGGLAGVKAYQAEREGRRKQELSRAQVKLRAQQLMDQMTRHNETLGSLDTDRKERAAEAKRLHDLQDAQRRDAIKQREEAKAAELETKRDLAARTPPQPGEGVDAEGNRVPGAWVFNPNKEDGAGYEFKPGMVVKKGGNARTPGREQMLEKFRQDYAAENGGKMPSAAEEATFWQGTYKKSSATPESEVFNTLRQDFKRDNGRDPNGEELAGLRQKAVKQSDNAKQRTVTAHEVVNYIDEALARVKAAKRGESGPVSGVKGDVNRLFETGKGMLGMEHDTTPSDFQQRIDLIVSTMPRVMQGTSRINKAEAERAERIVGGLARLKTEDDVISNLTRLRESMINIAGSEPPPKTKSGAAAAPAKQRPAWVPDGALLTPDGTQWVVKGEDGRYRPVLAP